MGLATTNNKKKCLKCQKIGCVQKDCQSKGVSNGTTKNEWKRQCNILLKWNKWAQNGKIMVESREFLQAIRRLYTKAFARQCKEKGE